ncbi:MAG TPA: tetratricopeptide repeat protein [Bacteroidales bacterium]|nr:tetratricopeptide repeat protein [Bacteroidales bacterium]HRW96718.1 tetratricopeptide repeat protein [Bacteroidales bacterium]
MKNVFLIVLGIMLASATYSQVNNRTAAFNHLRYGRLDKAKEAIDKAVEHPKTIADAKTWFYYGNVYLAIQLSEEDEFGKLDENALDKAFQAYQKALELDEKEEHKAEINERLIVCSEQYFNRGVGYYNESRFEEAAASFEQAVHISNSLGVIDTIANFYTAQSAFFSNNYEKAKEYLGKLKSIDFKDPAIYRFMTEIYKTEGDTVTALANIQEGREKFPEDFSLIIEEINIYLATGDKEKAMELLQLAITKDQTNPTLFFAVATNYDQLGNFEEAEKNYKKAIELDSVYFDPNYNLGALYVNKAIAITEEANALPLDQQKKFEELKQKANEFLQKSIPYLETADRLNPNDVYVLRTLRDIYARLGMLDKMKDMDQKLQEKNQD